MYSKKLIVMTILLLSFIFACTPPGIPSLPGGSTDDNNDGPYTVSAVYDSNSNPDSVNAEIMIQPDWNEYPEGTEVTITLPYYNGYSLNHWEGDFAGIMPSTPSFTFNISSDVSLVAHMNTNHPTVNVIFDLKYYYTDGNPAPYPDGIDPFTNTGWEITPQGYLSYPLMQSIPINEGTLNPIRSIISSPGWYLTNIESFSINLIGEEERQPRFLLDGETTAIATISNLGNLERANLWVPNDYSQNYTAIKLKASFLETEYSILYFVNSKNVNDPANSDLITQGRIVPSTGDVTEFNSPTYVSILAKPNIGYKCSTFNIFYVNDSDLELIDASITNPVNFTVNQPIQFYANFTPITNPAVEYLNYNKNAVDICDAAIEGLTDTNPDPDIEEYQIIDVQDVNGNNSYCTYTIDNSNAPDYTITYDFDNFNLNEDLFLNGVLTIEVTENAGTTTKAITGTITMNNDASNYFLTCNAQESYDSSNAIVPINATGSYILDATEAHNKTYTLDAYYKLVNEY